MKWLGGTASLIFAFAVVTRAFAATPTVSIISPSSNQILSGGSVTVVISVPNINLVDYRLYPRPNTLQGHLHLWLDQTDLSKATAIKSASPNYTFENVRVGPHTLAAELVKNDHSSYSPPIRSTVSFQTVPTQDKIPSRPNSSLLALGLFTIVIIIAAPFLADQKRQVKPKAKKRHK